MDTIRVDDALNQQNIETDKDEIKDINTEE